MSKHAFSKARIPIERDNPAILREEDLCVKCGSCRRVCEQVISVGRLYTLEETNDTAICVNCGQCANVCPTGAIHEVYEYQKVKEEIKDNDKIVIFSTSPSVRVGLGEEFGMSPGSFVEGQMVAALRALGADYVLDTNFSADLTIMEEAAELINRITKKEKPIPQFTSCCPAWVKFVETFYPEYKDHISTAKSPIGMQGATIKSYFAVQNKINPEQIINVAVTPCTAKKAEIRREEMCDAAAFMKAKDMRDMDYVITTRELAMWLKEENIDFTTLKSEEYDPMMGAASGAGVIFGNTGGVMEAAIRTAYHLITKENPPDNLLALEPVRGMKEVKEAEVKIGDKILHTAVIHGLANAKNMLDQLKKGELSYDFIEVMNCMGGCIGGGGQPKTEIPITKEILQKRINSLYLKDKWTPVRNSYENPEIKKVYQDFYEKPCSNRAENLLHTSYEDKSGILPNGWEDKPLTN